jgi:hypothetical protein
MVAVVAQVHDAGARGQSRGDGAYLGDEAGERDGRAAVPGEYAPGIARDERQQLAARSWRDDYSGQNPSPPRAIS